VLDGRGNGHGYGLSQWGAYGYAVDFGWSSAQILDHYYGGTVAGTVALDTTITVRMQHLDDQQTAVVNPNGLLVVDGVVGGPWKSVLAREVSPSVYAVWARSDAQVCPAASDDPTALGWTLVAGALGAPVNIRTQADVATTSNDDLVAVCEPSGNVRSYRGVIRATNGTAGENRTVNELPIEHYLRAVIAKEMSPSWANAGGGRGAQALQAQAVAARSYALASNRYSYAKTCDLDCQFYRGAAYRTSVGGPYIQVEYPSTDAAVAATAGVVRRVGDTSGIIALTMFAASNGGWTSTVVGTPLASANMPFPAVVDEGDATALNPRHRWTATLTAAAIAAKYPSIGTFSSVTILARNGFGEWGGRVTLMRVNGTTGSVTVTGDAFRSAFGLTSTWFNPR
jgi:SpoIID/LytB domain protein